MTDTNDDAPQAPATGRPRGAAARIAELEAENEKLRAELAARPGGPRPAPVRASLNLSEGTRAALEAHRDDADFTTRDPFTGETLTPADLDRLEGGNRPAGDAE